MRHLLITLTSLLLCLAVSTSATAQKSSITVPKTLSSEDRQPNVILPEAIARQQATEEEKAILSRFSFSTLAEATEENMRSLELYIRHGELRPSRLESAKKTLARIKHELGLISSDDLAKYN